MKLNILGTGTFFANINRTSSSFLLEINDKKILIDCGPGTLVRLSQLGVSVNDIDYVFLTHFHPDHTSDLFPLFMNYRLSDLFSPGSITKFPKFFGPEGIEKFITNYSINSELFACNGWNKIDMIDYPSVPINLDNLVIKPFKVDHIAFGVPAKAYALRFEIDNKIITFSGDSNNCQGIKDATKNADIFVCDSSYPSGKSNQSHMDTYEIGQISQYSNVKKTVLVHFYPQFNPSDLVKEVKNKFDGEVIEGKDLSVIEL